MKTIEEIIEGKNHSGASHRQRIGVKSRATQMQNFGFNSGRYDMAIRTTQEVADILGCSKSYVWYVEQRAFKKLRAAMLPMLIDFKLA